MTEFLLIKQNILTYRDCNVAFKAKCSECLQMSFLKQGPSLLVQSWGRKEGHRDMAASKPPSLRHREIIALCIILLQHVHGAC